MTADRAAAAAAHWGALAEPPRLVSERENAVFELRFPDGRRAALRLHRPGYQSGAAIRSELELCRVLAAADFPTPAPIRAAGGELVVETGGRLASAVAWLEGVPLDRADGPLSDPGTALARQGELLAQLHRQLDTVVLPLGFTRPAWNSDGFLGKAPLWGRFWEAPALSAAERERLHAFREPAAAALALLPDFGLIHADLLPQNLMVARGGLWLIDFDDCGWGWRLYDLATALMAEVDGPHLGVRARVLLDAYAACRPLPTRALRDLTLLLALRSCASIGWFASRRPAADPGHRLRIDRALRLVRLWQAGETI